jgi:hypothetical protein
MPGKAKFELVVRATKDGKLLHEVAVPIIADWTLGSPPKLPPEAILAMTQYDVIENMAKNFIEAAEKAPIKAMMINLIVEASEKARKIVRSQTCVHGNLDDCHDCLVDEGCGRW